MRIRKHANPLNFPRDLPKLQMENLFNNMQAELFLEIGFAQGEFILETALKNPHNNYLGMEVRAPLVDKVADFANVKGIQNLKVICASSNNNIEIIPDGVISGIFVFFPDPWFKKRHNKRRIINPDFLQKIYPKLRSNAEIFFQTDVETLYQDTLTSISENPNYHIIYNNISKQINETGIASYYESRCLQNNWPIHRIRFTKL